MPEKIIWSVYSQVMQGSLVAQRVKNHAIQETQWGGYDQGRLLEEEMAIRSVFLPGITPWTEPGELLSMGWQKVKYDWAHGTGTVKSCILQIITCSIMPHTFVASVMHTLMLLDDIWACNQKNIQTSDDHSIAHSLYASSSWPLIYLVLLFKK